MIEQVSATQVDAFRRCARYWSYRYVHKMKTPSTPAQEKGSNIHKAIENWLKEGKIDPTWAAYVDAARKHIPEGPRAVERRIDLDTWEGGPKWVGYIDLLVDTDERLKILDYKTTSDFRYSRTPEELKTNLQMATYAWWAYRQNNDHVTGTDIEVGHIYLLTKTKIPQSKYVGALVNEATVTPTWYGALHTVAAMCAAETVKTEDLPPTTSSCDMYGGCPYRAQCFGSTSLFVNFGKGALMSNAPVKPSFMDRLNAATAPAQIAPTPAGNLSVSAPPGAQILPTPNGLQFTSPQPGTVQFTTLPPQGAYQVGNQIFPPPAAPPAPQQATSFLPPGPGAAPASQYFTGQAAQQVAQAMGTELPPGAGIIAPPPLGAVLAPDATPRAEIVLPPPEAAQEAAQEPKKGRGRPKKTQAAEEAPVLPTPSMTVNFPPNVHVSEGVPGLTLYVDCIPVKGSTQPALLTDFIAPLARLVAEQAGVPNYGLIPYGQGKALLQEAIRANIDKVPPVLVIHSMSVGAREALDVLIPYASKVTEGLRG